MLLTHRNNLFDEMFQDPFFTRSFDDNSSHQIMKTDILDENGNYILEIELPGYAKDDIKADLKDGYLCISAEHKKTDEEKAKHYIHRERYTGGCKRSFYIGKHVSKENIHAAFADGILTFTVPKETPKAIEEASSISIE